MIDIKDIKVLNKLDCICGKHEFTLADLRGLEQLTDTNGFYGNLVKHYSMSKCPECGKEIILLLRQKGQTWEIMNTAELEQKATELLKEEVADTNVGDLTTTEQTTMDSDEEKTDSQEFICPECKREFKSKSGLALHMKKHQN